MYKIELTTKTGIAKKQKDIFRESVQEADPEAECSINGKTCTISSSLADPEKLSYLLGITMGIGSPNNMMKLQILYED